MTAPAGLPCVVVPNHAASSLTSRGSRQRVYPAADDGGDRAAHGGVGETDVPLVLAVGDGSVFDGLTVVGVPDGVSVGLGVGVLVGVAAGVLDVLVLGVLVLGAGADGGAPRAGPTRLGP